MIAMLRVKVIEPGRYSMSWTKPLEIPPYTRAVFNIPKADLYDGAIVEVEVTFVPLAVA